MTAVATSLPVASQEELIARAARGDTRAFERLIAGRAERSFRIARAILGNDADAHDATQEAFVSAWRALPRLRNLDLFDAWVGRILVNACRAQLRGRRRIREIPLATDFDALEPGPTTADRVVDSDLLAHAFERLDAAKRSILVLHYLEHEPVATIAATLGVPVGTVKWRLSDARAALQRALAAEGESRR